MGVGGARQWYSICNVRGQPLFNYLMISDLLPGINGISGSAAHWTGTWDVAMRACAGHASLWKHHQLGPQTRHLLPAMCCRYMAAHSLICNRMPTSWPGFNRGAPKFHILVRSLPMGSHSDKAPLGLPERVQFERGVHRQLDG